MIFLYNSLLTKHLEMNIPSVYLCTAKVEGKLFTYPQNPKETFMIESGLTPNYKNRWVYGIVIDLPDEEFYLRILDSYMICSKSALRINHDKDIYHRKTLNATPILYDSLKDLSRLKYTELEPIPVETYVGNMLQPKLKKRISSRGGNSVFSYRVECGLSKCYFLDYFKKKGE